MLLERLVSIIRLLLVIGCAPLVADIPITVEHAVTPDALAWGLMQRRWLPTDHGMLFHYLPPQRLSFWMLNTFLDLSVAFIDAKGIIREIHELKAYPERMRFMRPITDVKTLKSLPNNHPVVMFFSKHAVKSSFSATYALEMPTGWFQEHDVRVGARIIIDNASVVIEER